MEQFEINGTLPPGLTPNGMRYDDELVSADGCAITLIPGPTHTDDDVAAASAWVLRERDVVVLRVDPAARWGWASWYARDPERLAFLRANVTGSVTVGDVTMAAA